MSSSLAKDILFIYVLLTFIIIVVYNQIASLNIAQKSAADFMQIDETDIIYIIVYNSWTTPMPLRGSRSPVAPFLCSDVKSYGKEKYSVIRFSYSLIIHCFNGK